ncbi:protein of unknown function [Actinopolyspora lacussalsi subsp. righensis]|uniref:DUF397 domain-containing protein n=1 Tax=Actinopolyspora righensis TaxID=995060 RepID=A0A1I7BGN7_9ACTN|nr:DUF397 domain-containing protein [Actinopolyspora righensis]SFT86281.1 protein of unknown function [Actinopolyspora righensis]
MIEFTAWRKSSRSSASGNCIEVGFATNLVGVRDTKDRDHGILAFPEAQWQRFIDDVKRSY